MKKILSADDIVAAIDAGYASEMREKARDYIGASIIGNPCDALLAFSLRGFPEDPIDPRIQRVFRMGHMLEDVVVNDLKRKAEVRVWEKDGITGRQHAYEEWGGHISCHMDGHVELDDGVVRVLEIKSMNDASFKKFKSEGVKFSHPRYFAQLQMMMGMSGIPQSVFVATNKNNQEYHAEIVDFDEFEYAHICERISHVMSGKARKIATDHTDWRCRGCFKSSVCWHGAEVHKSCVTCGHATPHESGDWWCERHDRMAENVCDDYKRYEPLPKE